MPEEDLPTTEPLEVLVNVSADHLTGIQELASALEAAGLEQSQVLGAAGVVTGRVADRRALAAVRSVEGVEAVEVSRTVQLPPPEADLQ
jgi:uncharacterized protein YgbK (DUF1537 family)